LEYRFALVVCLFPSVNWVKNARISSAVMDSNSLSPKRLQNLGITNAWLLVVFFFGIYSVIVEKTICRF